MRLSPRHGFSLLPSIGGQIQGSLSRLAGLTLGCLAQAARVDRLLSLVP